METQGDEGQPCGARLEAEFEQALLRLNRQAGLAGLTAGAAHNLNNAVTSIAGYASMLAALSQDATFRDYGSRIMDAVGRITQITDGLLRHAANLDNEFSPVHPKQVIAPVVELFSCTSSSSAWVSCDIPPDLPLIMAAPTPLRQALLNVLINAAESMPTGGKICASVRLASGLPADSPAAHLASADVLHIEISDTGDGIPAAAMGRVTELFFTTKGEARAGVGLWATCQILRQHGGILDIQSTPRSGTTVSIYLPVISEQEPSQDA